MSSASISPSPRKKTNQNGASDTYGKLYDALEGAHNLSKENMISIFKSGEELKTEIIKDLSQKLSKPTLISPSKA